MDVSAVGCTFVLTTRLYNQMSSSTPSTPPSGPTLLTGDEFVEVMKGKDKDFKPRQYQWLKSAVVIDNVIVTNDIITKEGDEFEHAIVILGGEFQSGFRIEEGEFLSDFLIEGGKFHSDFNIQKSNIYSDFSIQGGTFYLPFIIANSNFDKFKIHDGQFKKFIVSNNLFESEFLIFDGTFESEFSISHAEFESEVYILGGRFKGFSIKQSVFRDSFWIQGGKFNDKFLIYSLTEFKNSFWIEGGEFFRDFSIDIGTTVGNFTINRGFFYSDFNIVGSKFHSFSIHGGSFEGDFVINGDFQKEFLISKGEFKNRFLIENGCFKERLWIQGGIFKNQFLINNGQFYGDFFTTGGKFNETFLIHGGDFKDKFWIQGGEFYQVEFARINKISLRIKYLILNTNSTAFVKIDNILLGSFKIGETLKSGGVLYINNQELNRVEFATFANLGNVFFNNISVKDDTSTFQIINSHLGKMEFKDFPFEEFHRIEVSDSNCTEITTYGKNFSVDNVQMVDSDGEPLEKGSEQEYYARYQLYNDLAIAKEKQKDTDTALRFRAISNENLRKSLSYFSEKWTSKLSLTFSKLSNNYRQSWGYPLVGVLIIGPIFYALNLMTLGLDVTDFDCWSDFFIFLNPTHKFELLEDKCVEYGFLANGVDVVSRVFIGFFIYQFIQAFRKYGGR